MLVEQSTPRKINITKISKICAGAMFVESILLKTDQNRYYFTFQCVHIFEHVLQFLRCGKLVLPEDFNELKLL